jgi:hypothetical protein
MGVPKYRWEDGIRMDLWEVGWGGVEWIQLALDRGRWQSLLNMVMNLRVLAPHSYKKGKSQDSPQKIQMFGNPSIEVQSINISAVKLPFHICWDSSVSKVTGCELGDRFSPGRTRMFSLPLHPGFLWGWPFQELLAGIGESVTLTTSLHLVKNS